MARIGAGAVEPMAHRAPTTGLECGLQQPLGQLLQRPALAGQLQPASAGPAGDPVDQLLIDRVQPVLLLVDLGRVLGRHTPTSEALLDPQ